MDVSKAPASHVDSMDRKAKRAARNIGLQAFRRRGRRERTPAPDNATPGYQVVDRLGNCVAGEGFTMTPEEVIRFCGAKP